MFTLLDEQKARRFWEEELRQEGRAEGRAEGQAEGQAKGESLMAQLITRLSTQNRTEDMVRAATDPDFRQKLYQEFNLAR